MKRTILIAALLLAACNREEQPQPPTTAETERLNEAEEMLNALANQEEAAPDGAVPSGNSN